MIEFENPQNLEIFTSFKVEFDAVLKEKCNMDFKIYGINTEHKLAPYITVNDDPFATNTTIKPLTILFNELICKELKLTPKEHYAMIAHEVGHIIDSTPRIENEMQREKNADMFAVELGLKEDLLNGLRKIIESGKYSNEVKGIEERIEYLSTNQD